MNSDPKAVLDSCVLANGRLCDLLLRLAETPRLYSPQWSSEILDEVFRVQTLKLPKPYSADQAARWREAVTRAFPEATIEGWEALMSAMTNDLKDRHVLAAAVKSGVSLVVTFNLKHFPSSALAQFGIEAQHPQDFLLTLWSIAPAVVLAKLAAMARRSNGEDLEAVLIHLGKSVPAFSQTVLRTIGAR